MNTFNNARRGQKTDLLKGIERALFVERVMQRYAAWQLNNLQRKSRKQARLLEKKGLL